LLSKLFVLLIIFKIPTKFSKQIFRTKLFSDLYPAKFYIPQNNRFLYTYAIP